MKYMSPLMVQLMAIIGKRTRTIFRHLLLPIRIMEVVELFVSLVDCYIPIHVRIRLIDARMYTNDHDRRQMAALEASRKPFMLALQSKK